MDRHWYEKNVFPWAKEYMISKLVGLQVSQGTTTVKVDGLKDIKGDVDLNQRKGKLLTIYDVAMTLNWSGLNGETEAKGTIVMPELMHDTEMHELVFEITLDKETPETLAVKQVVKTLLTQSIADVLSHFAKDLMDAHHKDVVIPKEDMAGHPVLETYQPKPPAPEMASIEKKVGSSKTVSIEQTINFVASASDMYQVLLDQGRVSAWTRSRADIQTSPGPFSLFEGNVTGSIVELVPNKTLVMHWRLKTWPPSVQSLVRMDLEQGSDSTTLKLVQTGVPFNEKVSTEGNWKNYYWNPIKATFGYGALL